MLINYEASDSVVIDHMSMLNPRRIPNGSSGSMICRPSTCSSIDRSSSATSRSSGPASRVYKNMQRQIYKLWYDQMIPPAKALAYLRGRHSSDVMFTISGHPVHLSSTSVNLQQNKNIENFDSSKNSLPDMKFNGSKYQNVESTAATPVSRSPFRESPKKNLLSPAYIGGPGRDHYSRKHNSNSQEQSPPTSNGLVINAQSMTTSPNANAVTGQNGEQSQLVISRVNVDNSLEKIDFDEVDGRCGPLQQISHKVQHRCNVSKHEKGSSVGSDVDLISEGSIIISNAISQSKTPNDDNSNSRVTTANIASINRRNRPFSSMTTSSKYGRCSDDYHPEYSDPYSGGPALFQQRLMDIANLESETVRWERLKASRRKTRAYTRQD